MFEKQYKQNLEYFKNFVPSLYQVVLSENTDDMLLSIDGENINVSKGNSYLYPKESKKFIEESVQKYIQSPEAFSFQPSKIDTPHIYEQVHSSFIQNIDDLYDKFTSKTKKDSRLESINILLLFGIGTGIQIEELLKRTEIQHLIIIDMDYKFVKVSMYFINWIKIIQEFSKEDKSITFVINNNVINAVDDIINALFKDKMMFSYHINFFKSYNNSFFDEALTNLRTRYEQLFLGWGFYDDELTSFKHTLENLKNNIHYYNIKNNQQLLKNGSVFIVANGPSLDNDIENIKKNMDKAVVFSCGTALKVLEYHNIIPDYHFEVERNKINYDIIIDTIDENFLKKINFIGLNVIYPLMFDLFKSKKLIFRENDAGASVSDGLAPNLEHCNPTVANMALSFASHIGFENIYMFGMDMGFLEPKKHHSNKSAYFDKDKTINYSKRGANKFFSGNLNNNLMVMSTTILSWCKTRAENCIIEYNLKIGKHTHYYNCSNGAYINGTIPQKSSDIGFQSIMKDKSFFIKKIEKSFRNPSYDIKKLKKNLIIEKDLVEKNIDLIINKLQTSKIENMKDIYSILYTTYKKNIYYTIEKRPNKSSLLSSLVKGTLVTLYARIYVYSLSIENLEELKIFVNRSFAIVIDFLEKVKSEINKLNLS